MSTASSSVRTAADLRRAFLDYFKSQGHTEVPSSPLVPNDPTLLFTTAGMVQFKSYYTATGELPYTRAVSVQKCLRLTDLDNVGITPRHDTFFEMLGNFSFGARDKGAYFKEEAVAFAWEFVTKVLGMPKDRLYPSIFEGEGTLPRDDEAIALWKKMGVPESRIVPLGRKDNFWGPAGGAGACGPCSEIYFDLGEKRPDYLAPGAFWGERPGDPGDRFMEFWNLVFPQFDASPDGKLAPLARPGIDTGMGIERLSLIMQGKNIIFETDVFEPVVRTILDMSKELAGLLSGAEQVRDARIIADHVRGLVFAIAEGAMPSNEGAGYVLRRLLRRAVMRTTSLRLGGDEVLAASAKEVIRNFSGHYPELAEHEARILGVLDREASRFNLTFGRGLTLIEKYLSQNVSQMPADIAFELHDTFGMPIDVTTDLLRSRGVSVDQAGFERLMEEQRARARRSGKFAGGQREETAADWEVISQTPGATALEYGELSIGQLTIVRFRRHESGELDLILNRTPFYPESGGQVSDVGVIGGLGVETTVLHVFKEDGEIVHRVQVDAGPWNQLLTAGANHLIWAEVDSSHRTPTERHHTATHLLHAALRSTLGTHVKQAGSLVASDRLRFDFSHFEAASPEQLAEIERIVSQWITARRDVGWREMPIAEAKALGAMALFGEKYGAEVRMVTVDGVPEAGIEPSRELCGGTHVRNTGDIGAFLVVSESAIAAGVRRLEARCGAEAIEYQRAKCIELERKVREIQEFLDQHSELRNTNDETWLRTVAAFLVRQFPSQTGDEQFSRGMVEFVRELSSTVERTKGELDAKLAFLKHELATLKKAHSEAARGGLEAEMARLESGATAASNGRWIVARIESEADANAVRDAADRLRGSLGTGAAVLALQSGEKLTFLAAVTDDLVASKKLNASDLVKKVALVTGGSGGGKPHLALAGGKDVSKLEAALDEASRILKEALS